jgi:glycosyltransferase involved in cell wall biosynthesis
LQQAVSEGILMFVFITSVKHPHHSKSYEKVWGLLKNTLKSICNQTDDDFRVIVVCNDVPDEFKDISTVAGHTTFVRVPFPPIPRNDEQPKAHIKLDKGTKRAVGLREAAKYSPDYVMFFDADDFVGRDIVEYCRAHPGRNGWYIHKGYLLLGDLYAKQNHFNRRCGTCNIISFGLLMKHLDASKINPLDRDSIVSSVDNFFLNFILGSHKYAPDFFQERGTPLKRYPRRAAIWLLDHGENVLDNQAGKVNRRLRPMDDGMRDYFNIPR